MNPDFGSTDHSSLMTSLDQLWEEIAANKHASNVDYTFSYLHPVTKWIRLKRHCWWHQCHGCKKNKKSVLLKSVSGWLTIIIREICVAAVMLSSYAAVFLQNKNVMWIFVKFNIFLLQNIHYNFDNAIKLIVWNELFLFIKAKKKRFYA